jgi:hypothetical protein
MATPVTVGGAVEDDDADEDVPECAALMISAARSDCVVSTDAPASYESEWFTYQAVEHRHEVRRHLEGEERGVHDAEARGAVLHGVSISRVPDRMHHENCVCVVMHSPRCCSS